MLQNTLILILTKRKHYQILCPIKLVHRWSTMCKYLPWINWVIIGSNTLNIYYNFTHTGTKFLKSERAAFEDSEDMCKRRMRFKFPEHSVNVSNIKIFALASFIANSVIWFTRDVMYGRALQTLITDLKSLFKNENKQKNLKLVTSHLLLKVVSVTFLLVC